MNQLDLILSKLKQENINASIEDGWRISWKDARDEKHRITRNNVAVADDRLAWFQSDLFGKHLLRVFDKNYKLNWEPITHNPVFGCDCLLIQWYSEHLVFIYIEKHNIYICRIKDGKVSTFDFHGEEIIRRGDIVYFKDYDPDTGFIKRFDLSNFELLDAISSQQANTEGVYPISADRHIGIEEI